MNQTEKKFFGMDKLGQRQMIRICARPLFYRPRVMRKISMDQQQQEQYVRWQDYRITHLSFNKKGAVTNDYPQRSTQIPFIRRLLLATLALSCVFLSLPVNVNAWPKISLGEDIPICQEVGKIALATFHSTSYIRNEYAVMQLLSRSIILGPTEMDLSGGDALKANPDFFDKIRNRHSYRGYTYWQKSPYGNYRFVLHETPLGWKGDIFNLFAWPADLSIEDFWDHFAQYRNVSVVDSAFISGAWPSPLVFSTHEDDRWWVLYVGQYQYFGTWTVFSFSSNGANLVCQIDFGPDVEDTLLLLPEPVRAFAESLFLTLGYDTCCGNWGRIVYIKSDMQTEWANAVLRPWAITKTTYNTTAQVERGLEAWADLDDWNRNLYEQIKAQYPEAENALTLHYQDQFNHSSEDARTLAREVLDSVYRGHYVFKRNP